MAVLFSFSSKGRGCGGPHLLPGPLPAPPWALGVLPESRRPWWATRRGPGSPPLHREGVRFVFCIFKNEHPPDGLLV